jgi:hypothetical protein
VYGKTIVEFRAERLRGREQQLDIQLIKRKKGIQADIRSQRIKIRKSQIKCLHSIIKDCKLLGL